MPLWRNSYTSSLSLCYTKHNNNKNARKIIFATTVPVITDSVSLTISSRCEISRTAGSGNYSATLASGSGQALIGSSTFKMVCNDSGGWELFAVGAGSDPNSVASLYNAPSGLSIPTGTSGEGSFWNMTITPVSGAYTPTIRYGSSASAIPTTETKVAYYNGVTDSAGSSLTVDYRATVPATQPATTYSGKVTYRMSHPYTPPPDITKITTMQEMTSEVCATTATPSASTTEIPSNQLRDTRDNKLYWVAKLADGNCWMTQNLDFDINAATVSYLTNTYTDLNSKSSWVPDPAYYTKTATSASSKDADYYSWDLGDYVYNGTTNSSCGANATSYADCTSYGFSPAAGLATGSPIRHYHAGNLYHWNAATAGSGVTISGGQAPDSVCPKGWKLPDSASTGEFQSLINAYSAGSSVQTLLNSPLYFVRGGYVRSGTLRLAGSYGRYWSSMSNPDVSEAYDFLFTSTTQVDASNSTYKYNGFSVRCVAR